MDAIYLRKSRLDLDAERMGDNKTLDRHRKALLELAKRQGRMIGEVYEEVRSGDSISARPEMQRLLHDVESGKWESVLVMEIERLARGDSIDQGIVSQTFKNANTKIVTPMKIYDPSNEFDEEFFEFGLFMSRREYKTIKRRMTAGRIAAVREGKYLGKTDPFGYRRVRVENGKGWTLEIIPEEAEIVRRVFRLASEGNGLRKIARIMTDDGVPSPRSAAWSEGNVRMILENEVYRGDIPYGKRPAGKRRAGGVLSRPANENYMICKGLHAPIVTPEEFEHAHSQRKQFAGPPVRGDAVLHNPFQGLMFCRKCGHKLQLVLKSSSGRRSFTCRYVGCDNVSASQEIVENAVRDAIFRWIDNYAAEVDGSDEGELSAEAARIEKQVDELNRQAEQQQARMARAYDMLEQGIYEPDEFLRRRSEIQSRTFDIKQSIAQLEQRAHDINRLKEERAIILPRLTNIAEVWHTLPTAEEKNKLLKSGIERMEYLKVGKNDDYTLNIWIYPILPKE